MKRILAYGDSNTFGYRPGKGGRYGTTKRWPTIAARLLGADTLVAEDGANGRTARFPDPGGYYPRAIDTIAAAVQRAAPLDLLVVMLGSNDLRAAYGANPDAIAQDVVHVVNTGLAAHPAPPPQVLLLAPPPLLPPALDGDFYDESALLRSRQLAGVYAALAQARGWAFLDAGQHTLPSEIDGLHLDEVGHRALAEAVVAAVRKLTATSKPCPQ